LKPGQEQCHDEPTSIGLPSLTKFHLCWFVFPLEPMKIQAVPSHWNHHAAIVLNS
jgi:hypothetical protein